MDQPINGHSVTFEPKYIRLGGALQLSNRGQLEMLRAVMARGVPLRMPVRGQSMLPFIHDLDVLTIEPMVRCDLEIGDVVAFTFSNLGKLVIHRVVARKEGGWCLRGDNCPAEDGIIDNKDIIGRVVKVERNGRKVNLGMGRERFLIASLSRNRAFEGFVQVCSMAKNAASWLVQTIQGLSFYRCTARRLVPKIIIRPSDESDLMIIRKRLISAGCHSELQSGPDLDNWVACTGNKVIGFVQGSPLKGSYDHPAAYWLSYLYVWPFYRGMGIGETFTRRIIEDAQKMGADQLYLAVNSKSPRQIRFVQKLGCTPVNRDLNQLAILAEHDGSSTGQVIMGLPISDR